MNNLFLLFYSPKPRSQVRILIYQNSAISHFERILEKKYETEKCIAFKSNRIISFCDKWKSYENLFLSG